MGEDSHRESPREGVRPTESAVWRPPAEVRPPPPGLPADKTPVMAAPFTSPLAEELADDLLQRFLRYVRVDTQSARDRTQSPSTPGQLDLSRMLLDELREIGLE